MPIDWTGHYAIVDPAHCKDVVQTTEAILAGGCSVLQFRDKGDDDRSMLDLARRVRVLCAAAEVPFVMNDRVDMALLLEADGVHLGQADLLFEDARRLFRGPIGVSTHSLQQAQQAWEDGADLIGFGPVFGTQSKENPDPQVGLALLGEVCELCPVPVVAIGGLTVKRVPEVRRAGATLGAAIGAVCGSDDPRAAAAAMTKAWQ